MPRLERGAGDRVFLKDKAPSGIRTGPSRKGELASAAGAVRAQPLIRGRGLRQILFLSGRFPGGGRTGRRGMVLGCGRVFCPEREGTPQAQEHKGDQGKERQSGRCGDDGKAG